MWRGKRFDNGEYVYWDKNGKLLEKVSFGGLSFGKGVNIKTVNLTKRRVDVKNAEWIGEDK